MGRGLGHFWRPHLDSFDLRGHRNHDGESHGLGGGRLPSKLPPAWPRGERNQSREDPREPMQDAMVSELGSEF